jgi:tRNA (guanine-N7-)-methyltransferase
LGTSGERAPRRILHGRKRGRRLRAGRQALVEEVLPRLALELPAAGARLDPRGAFAGGVDDVWLEVGFGDGGHLATQARAHPGVGLIGCEPYVDGVAKLVRRVVDAELGNVRLFVDDARLLIDALAEASIGRAFALFLDPWPKKRHHKRRFISGATLEALARALKDGAELRLATDDPGYCRWILAHALAHPAFEWPARGPRHWRRRPADWPPTRYEEKAAAEGRRSVYLTFRRRPRGLSTTSEAAQKP